MRTFCRVVPCASLTYTCALGLVLTGPTKKSADMHTHPLTLTDLYLVVYVVAAKVPHTSSTTTGQDTTKRLALEPGAEDTSWVVDLDLPAHGSALLVALARVALEALELGADDSSSSWGHLDAVASVCAVLVLVSSHDHREVLAGPDAVGHGSAFCGDGEFENHCLFA